MTCPFYPDSEWRLTDSKVIESLGILKPEILSNNLFIIPTKKQ